MLQIYKYLTRQIISKFGNRKGVGLLSLIINMITQEIYVIPKNKEHIDFVAEDLLGVSREDIIKNPNIASHFIPVLIQYDTDVFGSYEVVGIGTGVSSLELAGNVYHEKGDLVKAHELAWQFIENGDILLGEIKENVIFDKYAFHEKGL